MLPTISFFQNIEKNNDLSLSENNTGYLYNVKTHKYYNCPEQGKTPHTYSRLSDEPLSPFTIGADKNRNKVTFKCPDGRFLNAYNQNRFFRHSLPDISEPTYFKVDVVSSNKFDEIVLQLKANSLGALYCIVAENGGLRSRFCDLPGTPTSLSTRAQTWYWIPEKAAKDSMLNQNPEFLNK
ncbi:hypothetical protein CDIK_0724 [Cucumispora dikerogammari]|nr:hypothetical protein CDIK_0724 [Cucumispora dikerogammari]